MTKASKMMQVVAPSKLSGNVCVPASKSDAQRAILAAALAKGTSELIGIGPSDDEQAMLKAIEQLGARITVISATKIQVEGMQQVPVSCHLSVGESGLAARLLSAVCATFHSEIVLEGHGSLNTRPFHFYEEVLPQFGARVTTTNGCLPITVNGPLQGNAIAVDGSLSSQYISGLLMALPLANGNSSLQVNHLASSPYVSMTMATLKAFGIDIEHAKMESFSIKGNQNYHATTYQVDGDWSAASYWLVAAAIGHSVSISGLKMSSLQADKQLLDILMKAGCKIIHGENGLQVDGSNRMPFECDATDCPDLFPALVVLAASVKGVSTIKGALRLIHKESNRAAVLKQEFAKLGVLIELNEDEMLVHGTGEIAGGEVHANNDHRIAMCLAIAGTIANAEVTIHNSEAVSKSYPEFWKCFDSLMG